MNWKFRSPALLVATLGLVALALICHGAETIGVGKEETAIPEIARLAGVKIGYSTQDDLAKQWGEGEVVIGGHPNSGRIWRVKGTSWVVRTDGFDYSQRGLVVDGLTLEAESKEPQRAPFAHMSKDEFHWLGGIAPGMRRSEVEKFLQSKSLLASETEHGLAVHAKGHHVLVNSTLSNWTVKLDFTADRLSRLVVDASP